MIRRSIRNWASYSTVQTEYELKSSKALINGGGERLNEIAEVGRVMMVGEVLSASCSASWLNPRAPRRVYCNHITVCSTSWDILTCTYDYCIVSLCIDILLSPTSLYILFNIDSKHCNWLISKLDSQYLRYFQATFSIPTIYPPNLSTTLMVFGSNSEKFLSVGSDWRLGRREVSHMSALCGSLFLT